MLKQLADGSLDQPVPLGRQRDGDRAAAAPSGRPVTTSPVSPGARSLSAESVESCTVTCQDDGVFRTVARAQGTYGELVVRRADDGAIELRVNGVFAMGSAEHASEDRLADAALSALAAPRRVLVGGLGLGFTVRRLLADPRVEQVLVAELEPQIPAWMRSGVLPGADLLDDPRLELRLGDVRDLVQAGRGSLDAILLDVDNGPDHLLHTANADLYTAAFLGLCARRLTRDGVVCLWSQADSPAVRDALAGTFHAVEAEAVPVDLGTRTDTYWLLSGIGPLPR